MIRKQDNYDIYVTCLILRSFDFINDVRSQEKIFLAPTLLLMLAGHLYQITAKNILPMKAVLW